MNKINFVNALQALRGHVDDEDMLTRKIDGSGQNRNFSIINESGLYSLILSSKLPKAKEFKHWVTSEVLPVIRKTGKYEVQNLTPEQVVANALIVANNLLQKKISFFLKKVVDLYLAT